MVVGNKDKRGRKKEKEGRGFRRLPFYKLSSFFVCFLEVYASGGFGPNFVVFFVICGFD